MDDDLLAVRVHHLQIFEFMPSNVLNTTGGLLDSIYSYFGLIVVLQRIEFENRLWH